MAQVLEILREEHAKMSELLRLLRRQIGALSAGEVPDYALLNDLTHIVADYFEGYHHPKENLIYERLKARDPAAAEQVGDLAAEHRELDALTEALADVLGDVMMEAQVSRLVVRKTAQDFVARCRRHMEMEETEFFPIAEEWLTAADWDAIEAAVAKLPHVTPGRDRRYGFQAIISEIERATGPA